MRAFHRILLAGLATAFLLTLMLQTTAAQGRHPHYLHALSDLRAARALIAERPEGGLLHEEEKDAIKQIDAAIGDIKKASIDDGKNLNDHPPIDANLHWDGRLHEARQLLDKARKDISQEEDDPAAIGLQARVLDHVDHAIHRVDDAIAIVSGR